MTPVEEAADMVAAEAERVCEMADDLAKLAIKLGRQTLSTAARAG